MVRTLDGELFTRAVRAGTLAVVREQESLNRINVFPVRDADTGANLAATLKSAAARLGSVAPEGVGAAAREAADGALDGARGNSGAIFAQFLHGLASGLRQRERVAAGDFAAAARRGADAAWAALAEPREGTILSVLRAWAHELERRDADDDLLEMLHRGLVAARTSLAATPRQLEVLARNHVVDAGGQGFVFFLEGLADGLHGRDTHWEPMEATPRGAPPFAAHGDEHVDERYRYCTEALLVAPTHEQLSRDAVLARVRRLGESLVIAGGEGRLRVHIHTNEPQGFLAELAGLGVVEHTKVDDMVLQQLAGRVATVALVTDSTTDLPDDVAFRLGVVQVPLTLSLGDEEYLDGVDVTLEAFIHRVQGGTAVPRSSQPAVVDFVETYRRLLEYRDGVLSVHIAGAMSGTVQAARQAARQVDPARVKVVDACSVSIGVGLVLEAVGEAIAGGADVGRAAAVAEHVKREVRLFGTVRSLEWAVRGGRVSPALGRTIDRLGLSPIIVFDDRGQAGKGGVALGFDRALDAIVRRGVRWAAGGPARVMVVHSGDAAGADFFAARVAARLRLDEVPVVRAGAVLTTHVGLGSVTVGVRRLPG